VFCAWLLFCTAEIVEYTSPDETAVCNLASIALPRFVRERSQQVSFTQQQGFAEL